MEGTLGERSLGQVLGTLSRRDRTGILTVQGASEIIALSFLEGEIVSADALNLTLEDGLGAVLADLDLVTPDDFAGLAAEHQAGGGRVGELLVERGFVTRPQLLGAIRAHIYRLSRNVLSWTEGEYKFYQGEEVSYEPGLTPIPVAELIFRAQRELDRPQRADLRYPESGSVYARSPGAFDGGLGSRGGEREPPPLAELGEEAREVFSRLDGATPASELAQNVGLQPFVVCYLLYRLERQQLIELTDSRPAVVAEPLADLELPELAPPSPAPVEPPRESLGQKLARLRPALPEIRESFFDLGARLAGLALLAWVAFYFVTATAGQGPALEGLTTPPTAYETLRRTLELERAHRGSRVFFLLYGRYPEGLDELAARWLLTEAAPARGLEYSATAVTYVVARPASGESAGMAQTGTIAGNFLLDPDFGVGEVSDRPPLVLLD